MLFYDCSVASNESVTVNQLLSSNCRRFIIYIKMMIYYFVIIVMLPKSLWKRISYEVHYFASDRTLLFTSV